jgi:hypothetical protein
MEAGHGHEVAADGAELLRRLAAVFAFVALLAGGCGGGSDSASPDDIARAATKTTRPGSLEADFAISGQGLSGSGSGVFNTDESRSGQLSMKVTAGGPQIPVDTLVTGDVFYMRSPVFTQSVQQGKQWIKVDLAQLSAQRGLDVTPLLTASPTPANALAYLQGVSDVKEVGSQSVQGVKTTHYRVTVDVHSAVNHASGRERTTLERVISQSKVETLPMDVWIDRTGYIRKVDYEEHAGRQQAAAVKMELHDFGPRVQIKPPPKASVIDLGSLQGGA